MEGSRSRRSGRNSNRESLAEAKDCGRHTGPPRHAISQSGALQVAVLDQELPDVEVTAEPAAKPVIALLIPKPDQGPQLLRVVRMAQHPEARARQIKMEAFRIRENAVKVEHDSGKRIDILNTIGDTVHLSAGGPSIGS